jgi:uncharacterized protein YkwD
MRQMRILRPFILLLACVVFVAPAGGASASSSRAYTSALVQAINGVRAANGVPPLQVDVRLMRSAHVQSSFLAAAGRLDHTGADGSSVLTRVNRAGYHGNMVGENLAAGMSPAATVRDWMSDPGHRSNLLEPHYHVVGVAVVTGTLGGGSAPFVTADFGS